MYVALATCLFTQQARKIDRSLRKYRSGLSLGIKMAIVGSGGIGKSCLAIRYVQGVFIEGCEPSIEDSYQKQVATTVRVRDLTYGINAILDMVDTAGTEQFDAVREIYFSNADIVLICYSIICRASFEEVKHLSQLAQRFETPYIIIGLKKDFRNSDSQMVEVSPEEGRELAHQLRAEGYFECSAKTGEGVDEVFDATIQIGVQNELKAQMNLEKKSKCALF